MPEFSNRDPLAPAFWDERFDRRFTPWDRGEAPAELREFVAQTPGPLSVLAPGCGAAYELELMLEAASHAAEMLFVPAL